MEPIETERLLLLPAHPDLAWKTADFYHKNRDFFAPLDPQREASFFIPEGQQVLLEAEREQFEQRQSFRFYLVLRQQPGGDHRSGRAQQYRLGSLPLLLSGI